ncbi:unnamed protein product [Miscanthus lutarioriparius]|uniref:BI1-like protein n=1 Tax=Miscanthus lutarioriparius TaxID=422564 RepID=A0A811MMN8_9POAL|nr:unnamed protein product [Miscanthus lutarioriparius]
MGKHGKCSHDTEACYPPGADGGMYPYMMESPQLRWAFIRKVYAIVCLQLLLTVAVAATVNLVGAIGDFFRSRTMGAIAATIAVIIFPILASPWGSAACRRRARHTGGGGDHHGGGVGAHRHTFWAAKQGYDFEFLGPFLMAAVLILMLFGLVRILFPLGKTGTMVYGCIAALVFSGFIIYDTDNLIKRYSYDEYVAAAIELYLDVINLFQAILAVIEGVD